MDDLQNQIEVFLLNSRTWVPTAKICERFNLNERALRAKGQSPGLLDSFAVSSTRQGTHGFIHHRWLPIDQWLPIKHRLRRHAIGELRKVSNWSKARKNILTGEPIRERHTQQLLLFK